MSRAELQRPTITSCTNFTANNNILEVCREDWLCSRSEVVAGDCKEDTRVAFWGQVPSEWKTCYTLAAALHLSLSFSLGHTSTAELNIPDIIATVKTQSSTLYFSHKNVKPKPINVLFLNCKKKKQKEKSNDKNGVC